MKDKGSIVLEYVKRYKASPSRAVAKQLAADFPEIFPSAEHARRIVRYYRGASGAYNRDMMDQDKFEPRFSIPEQDDYDFSPFIMPDDAYPVLGIGDVHVPYHDQDALEITLEYAYKTGTKSIAILGDFLDCYQVSRFERDPSARSIPEELDIGKNILGEIKKALPGVKIYYKIGNHEERWDDYLKRNAPEMWEVVGMRFVDILKNQWGIDDIIADKRLVRLGRLNMIHGHELGRGISAPVNPARGLFLRAKKSAIEWHYHQTSEHTEPTINDDVITCWSVGCMCDLHPKYMPYNKWNHGFARITNEDDMFIVNNHRIIHNKVM